MDDQQFRTWKTQLVPLLYDWFSNHNLTWPTQACRWGPRLEEHTYKSKYRLYLSEQTDDTHKEPSKLLVVDAEICKPRVASAEVVTTWNELSKCPYIRDTQVLVHPGEVNKIRELPQHPNVIVTHTDDPRLYVWNLERQPNHKKIPGLNKEDKPIWPGPATADLVLTGHKSDAQFPLATSSAAPRVLSGGTDCLVLAWDLADSMEGLLAKQGPSGVELEARWVFEGHTATVEDVIWAPGSDHLAASVGDDAQMLFWDARAGRAPVAVVGEAHGRHDNKGRATIDIHTLDWSAVQEHLVATGAADGSLRVWDRRKLGAGGEGGSAPLKAFTFHRDAIMRVEWHPTASGVLASGGEDHLVVLWSLDRTRPGAGAAPEGGAGGSSSSGRGAKTAPPPEVIFKHVGHRNGKVVDMQWCPADPWTIMSVSDDTAEEGEEEGGGRGGGTLQIWRISDLIYKPEEEVVAELEKHREWIIAGKDPPQQLTKAPGRTTSIDPAAAHGAPGPAPPAAAAAAAASGGGQEGASKQPAAAAAAATSDGKNGPPEPAAGTKREASPQVAPGATTSDAGAAAAKKAKETPPPPPQPQQQDQDMAGEDQKGQPGDVQDSAAPMETDAAA